MRTSACLMQRISDFSKFMVYPHGQVGLNQSVRFSNKVGGQFFVILYGRLLWTAPNFEFLSCELYITTSKCFKNILVQQMF